MSIDGINYFKDIIKGEKKPGWLDFSQQIGKLTGNYKLLNLATGTKGLENFLFKTHNWLIGGIHFDGIMRTEHTSRVRATTYPVQTGVTMTDHAINESAELTIEIIMSDANTKSFTTNNALLDTVYSVLQATKYSNILPMANPSMSGEGRSAKAWTVLKNLQQSRVPIQVVTRLQTYDNMLIEELSAPDDVKTLNALKATIRLKEVTVALTAQTKVSARPPTTQQANAGQVPVKTDNNSTAMRTIEDSIKDWLGGK